MNQSSLDATGRRELARLLSEEGLSPAEAAARLGVAESVARAWVGRWYAADEAAQRFAAFALRDEPVDQPARPADPRRRRVGGRQLAGIALVLAFVPVGWVASAAVFGGDDGDGRTRTRVEGAPVAEGGSTIFRAAAVRARRARHTSLAAHVRGARITVYDHPRRSAKHTVLRERALDGKRLPLVFLVEKQRARWLRVQRPTRPNLSTGWIRAAKVKLRTVEWRVRIDLSQKTVTTWRGARKISVHEIGVGRSVSPTPRGRYYLTDLVKPPDPNGLYGAYAFGLSAHSDVITSFGTGDGQIGIHGTNDPSTLGTEVSHGCIRVSNEVISSFARHFPLGTPVTIRS